MDDKPLAMTRERAAQVLSNGLDALRAVYRAEKSSARTALLLAQIRATEVAIEVLRNKEATHD